MGMLSRIALRIWVAGAFLGALAMSPAATSPVLVTEPDQGLAPIYNFIRSAKQTLDMTMYELRDSQAEELLAEAAAAGVKVRVILDQKRQKSANQSAYTYLSQNHVQVHWANPAYAATHQKTITVDGVRSAIMTLNLTSPYYSTSRDFAVIDNDPADVAAIERTFNADFANQALTPPNGDDLVWSPTNSETSLLNLIDSARYSLLIENEEMSEPHVLKALVRAAVRGVVVRITMTNTGNEYAREFQELVAAGARVSTYASAASLYIHAKVVVADYGTPEARVFAGSENFSTASLKENRELGLVTSDPTILASLEGTLQADFVGAVPWPLAGAPITTPPRSGAAGPAAGRLGPVRESSPPLR
jgi:phosphatidylserine/phosphatidylglycerophosphate/cardiolipin synthase-like enzyme